MFLEASDVTTNRIIAIISNKRNEMYGFATFTLLIVVLLAAFAIRPTIITIVKINQEIKDKTIVNEQLANKINALSSLGNDYSNMKDSFNDFQLLYPSNGDYSLFMANIESICERHSYTLDSVNFRSKEVGNSLDFHLSELDQWEATINITGTDSELTRLIDDIESMPMFPVVDFISYSNDKDEQGKTNFSIGITLFHVNKTDFYK